MQKTRSDSTKPSWRTTRTSLVTFVKTGDLKGLSQRAADFGTDHERAFRVLYVIFRIIEDGI